MRSRDAGARQVGAHDNLPRLLGVQRGARLLARDLAALAAVVLLASGCGNDDPPMRDLDPEPRASSATTSPNPGSPTTIPPDVQLPYESVWAPANHPRQSVSIADTSRAGIVSVAAYLPTLASFGD